MFTENERNEFLEDGLTEEEIDVLESSMALAETIEMLPKDVTKFIEEYKTKIPDDTVNSMRAMAYAAEHDPKFFNELMALSFVMAYDDEQNPKQKQVKTMDNLSDDEYLRVKHRFFDTLDGLSESESKEFLNLIVNITPEQKKDMIDRLKR
jgi:hypothetical protein